MLATKQNVTENIDIDNQLGGEHTIHHLEDRLDTLLNSPTARQALLVGQENGNVKFTSLSEEVWEVIKTRNYFRSANENNIFLLENYKVLHYSSNLDLIVSVAATEKFLQQLEWTGADRYYNSTRDPWFLDDALLGWVTQIGNFTRVVVRNAGHQTPHDQPKAAFLMMKNFVLDMSFLTVKKRDP